MHVADDEEAENQWGEGDDQEGRDGSVPDGLGQSVADGHGEDQIVEQGEHHGQTIQSQACGGRHPPTVVDAPGNGQHDQGRHKQGQQGSTDGVVWREPILGIAAGLVVPGQAACQAGAGGMVRTQEHAQGGEEPRPDLG